MPEKIGEGWQYKVFDKGGQVEKVPKSRLETAVSILKFRKDFLFRPVKFWKKIRWIHAKRDEALSRLESGDIPSKLVANARVQGDTVLQDKVEMVEDFIEGKEGEELEKVVDEYIDFLVKCWEHGFSETSYNFTINHGFDRDGEMVLVDIGEITFLRDKIEEHIEQSFWLTQSIYTGEMLPEEVKPYFRKRMEEEITVEKLDEKWRENMS